MIHCFQSYWILKLLCSINSDNVNNRNEFMKQFPVGLFVLGFLGLF